MQDEDLKPQERGMQGEDLKRRTKAYALRVIRVVESLPDNRTADAIGQQLLRNGTSVGAHYRAACRPKSAADFIAKMGMVEEEVDASLYWMELLIDSGLVPETRLSSLIAEGRELLAITIASIKTAQSRKA